MNLGLVERFNRNRAAQADEFGVLIIDMQPLFLNAVDNSEREVLIKAHTDLLGKVFYSKTPVFCIETDGVEPTIDPINQLLPSRTVRIIKPESNGFERTDLKFRLDEKKLKRLIAGGVFTGYCVKQTIKGALREGFFVYSSPRLVADERYSLLSQKERIGWLRSNAICHNDHKSLFDYLPN